MVALGANIQRFHLVMSEQEKLLSLLESNGITAVVPVLAVVAIAGTTLAVVSKKKLREEK